MNEDTPLRIALVVSFLVMVAIMVPHRIKSATGEKLDRMQEGLFILVTLRLTALVLFVAINAYVIHPASMAWSSVVLPTWLRWCGIAVQAPVAGLLLWAMRSLGKNLTDTVVTRKEHTMVTSGPYRLIRHPFYVAVGTLMLGSALAAANWFIFLAGATLFTFFAVRTRTEEGKLVERFGESYRKYMEQTGRFFPRIV